MPQDVFHIAQKVVSELKVINSVASRALPSDIEGIVKRHAKIAVATALIPFTGVDMAAATANVWMMYLNINKELGLSFSKNTMKSIGSAVAANLISNLGIAAVASSLKLTGVGYFAAVAILSPIIYAFTITAGWIYLKALSNLALHDNDIDSATKDVLRNYSDIKSVFENNK